MKLAICTDVFADLSYTDMLDKVKSLGIDAVEMTAGGWGARKHCNTAELLADAGKREAFMMELEKRGMRISALNTSCNPLWPSKTGEEYKKSMYDCATFTGLLGVKKIVAMAGLPAGNETDTTPNWITSTVSWPDFMAPAYEYQWKVTIEFWNEFIAHCKKCGIEHIAIEEFPGTMVWSASTLLKLREATDPMLGINLDRNVVPYAVSGLGNGARLKQAVGVGQTAFNAGVLAVHMEDAALQCTRRCDRVCAQNHHVGGVEVDAEHRVDSLTQLEQGRRNSSLSAT